MPSRARKSLLQSDRRSCSSSAELCSRNGSRKSFGLSVNCSVALSRCPVSLLSTTSPEGVIHQLLQHGSCRSCAGARHAVTARLSSGSPKAADARDSKHGRDSVASREHSALHTCFKRCRPNCLLARPCAVSTTRSARLLTGRWHAGQRFLNLMHPFGSATSTRASRPRTVWHACRCSRKLLDNASSWAHPVPLRPHHCVYVGRLLSSWLGVVRPRRCCGY